MLDMKEYLEVLIKKAFSNRNIVLWRDGEKYFENFFSSFHMDDVTNVLFTGSLLELKVQIEKDDPYIERKYLIYIGSKDFDSDYDFFARPIYVDLTEVLRLSFGVRSSKALDDFLNDYRSLVITSFEKLKGYYDGSILNLTGFKDLVLKMIFEINHIDMDDMVIKLLFSADYNKLFESISKPTLISYFYECLFNHYGLKINENNSQDFVEKVISLLLINSYYYQGNGRGMDTYESFIVKDDIKRERIFRFVDDTWRNNDKYKNEYLKYSEKYESVFLTDIEAKCVNEGVSINEINIDIFVKTDIRLFTRVKADISNIVYGETDTKQLQKVKEIAEKRAKCYWASNNIFNKWNGILYLINFLQKNINFVSMYKSKVYFDAQELINDYTKVLFYIDYYYRKFKEQVSELELNGVLLEKVDIIYSDFLSDINYKYSSLIERLTKYEFDNYKSQQGVWDLYRKTKGKKCVIYADALNYELAIEMQSKLSQYNCKFSLMISALPSITEIGMTRLIMEQGEIMIAEQTNKGMAVYTDSFKKDLSSRDNRKEKMLKSHPGLKFMSLHNLFTTDVDKLGESIVLFSRDIDGIGESGISFGLELFSTIIRDIVRGVKLLTSKGYTVLIASDHGFIYTKKERPVKAPDGNYIKLSYRYGIGKEIHGDHVIKDGEWCNIQSEYNFIFPRGITEYGIQGGSNEFKHGGISLQENIIPFIEIKPLIIEKEDQKIFEFKVPDKIRSKVVKIEVKSNKQKAEGEFLISLENSRFQEKRSFSVQIAEYITEIKYRLNENLPPNGDNIVIKIFDEESKLKLYESEAKVDMIDGNKLF